MEIHKLSTTTQNINYSSREFISDTWRLIRPYRLRFIFASLIRLISDLAKLYTDYTISLLVTFLIHYTTGGSLDTLWFIILSWGIAIIIRNLGNYTAKYHAFRVGERISIDAGLETIEHLFKLNINWHEKENTGNKIKKISNAQAGFNKVIRIWISNFIEIVTNFVVITVVMFTFDIWVALSIVVFIVTYYLISQPLTEKATQASYQVNVQDEIVSGIIYESIGNIRTVKVLGMQKNLYDRIKNEAIKLFEKIKYRIWRFGLRGFSLEMWSSMFELGIVIFVAYSIIQGNHEVGFLVLFIRFFSHARASIRELSDVSQEFEVSKYSISRMKDILSEPITIENDTGKKVFPNTWDKIVLDKISFRYDKKTSINTTIVKKDEVENRSNVIQDISLIVNRGEKIGIVGLSGGGKSTLFKLLLKEYEDYKGEIFIDSIPLKEIKKSSYLTHTAVVLQDTEVFNFSLRDNITIANDSNKLDRKKIQRAIEIAHVDDFMYKLPKGLDTLIGEKGVKLSGGERQRLGIARAVFKQPEILLLDEATSHLDIESEKKIQDSLHHFFQEVTAIVIAHRLSTIKDMDRIIRPLA